MIPPRPRRERGFTLIELLVVIGILGLLIVAFAPSLGGAIGAGDEATTRARQIELVAMAEAYQRYYGEFPPDDLSIVAADLQASWQLGTDNGKNTGIESLVMHLSQDPKAGGRLHERMDWLANTDGDKAPVDVPLLSTRERLEVVDAWGTPFAYFSATAGSAYQGKQRIVPRAADGAAELELVAEPWKDPATGAYLNPRKFQIVSAGADLTFNTDDDLVYPEIPSR